MKKTLLLLAVCMVSSLSFQAQTRAWFKTWLTPEKCVTGECTIQYDPTSDSYTIPTGLANDAKYPFQFKFVPSDGDKDDLAIKSQTDDKWFSESDRTTIQYNPEYKADIYAGGFYSLYGDFSTKGMLYLGQLAYEIKDESGFFSAINYFHSPTLIWPYQEPYKVIQGIYHDGQTDKNLTCNLEAYQSGAYVIKSFTGIEGYDICMSDSNFVFFDNYADWFAPQDFPDYQFPIYTRISSSYTDGAAKCMTNTLIDLETGKAEFTYHPAMITGWNGATYEEDKNQTYVDTFTWTPFESNINEVKPATRNQPTTYYDLTGRKVTAPNHGIYIKQEGPKITKVIM